MALLLLLFRYLLSAAFCSAAAAQQTSTNISLGSFLTPTGNSSWLSPSGHFAFGFYKQHNGYAVGIFIAAIPERTAVWTANRDSNPIFPSNSTLRLKNNGRLVVEVGQGQDQDIHIIPTHHLPAISSVSILDSGNFVIYGSDEKIIWQSFENPTNTLLPGQRLLDGRQLVSSASESDDSTGKFLIIMQGDGNLVQYPVLTSDIATNSYWSSFTDGNGDKITLNLEEDGYLYLINSTINIILNYTSRANNPKVKTIIYIAKIDVDGIFRVYSHPFGHGNWSVSWSTTEDKCSPKGLCRVSAYCTTIMDKEDCEQACLEQCNCSDAARFNDGECRKERLPLIYGRRSLGDSNVANIGGGEEGGGPVDHYRESNKDILLVGVSLLAFALLVLAISCNKA